MCIRDRVKLNQAEQFVKEAKELFAKYNIDLDEEEVSHVEELQDKICLLYTSDAADERSSVDLGGRRIIKKKKKVDIDGGACTARHGQ